MHSATSTHSVAPQNTNANPPDPSIVVALAVLANTSREREELQRLREREAWEREVRAIPNARCRPAGKLVLLDQWAEASYRRERGIDEPQPIWIEDRARRVGLSPDTYGRILKAQLARAGAIERTQVKDPDTGHTRVLVRHTEAFWEPSRLAPPEPRGHGGVTDPEAQVPGVRLGGAAGDPVGVRRVRERARGAGPRRGGPGRHDRRGRRYGPQPASCQTW